MGCATAIVAMGVQGLVQKDKGLCCYEALGTLLKKAHTNNDQVDRDIETKTQHTNTKTRAKKCARILCGLFIY